MQAKTGSGKTLAFLLPLLQLLDDQIYAPFVSSKKSTASSTSSGELRAAIGTCAMIIVPTRELAVQTGQVVDEILLRLHRPHWIVSGVLCGGASGHRKDDKKGASDGSTKRISQRDSNVLSSRKAEKARLRKGLTIVIGTPGRLLDHVRQTQHWVKQAQKPDSYFRWIIVDEADRLADMGFEPMVREIVHVMFNSAPSSSDARMDSVTTVGRRADQQLIMASATIGSTEQYAGLALRSPHILKATSIAKSNRMKDVLSIEVPDKLAQHYLCTPTKLRLQCLIGLFRHIYRNSQQAAPTTGKIIVFLSCCDAVDFFYGLFTHGKTPIRLDTKVNVLRLHGKMPQEERLASLRTFRRLPSSSSDGRGPSNQLLFCTDVAARGIDWPDITAIIQYDAPLDTADYVHRVGRTARQSACGAAYLMLMPSERDYVQRLESMMAVPITKVRVDALLSFSSTINDTTDGKDGNKIGADDEQGDVAKSEWQRSLESWIGDVRNVVALASKDGTISTQPMSSLATQAYCGTVRAYATHIAVHRDIFHVKRLHLGHLAGTFGLTSAPSLLTSNLVKRGTSAGKFASADGKGSKRRMSAKDRKDAEKRARTEKQLQTMPSKRDKLAFVNDGSKAACFPLKQRNKPFRSVSVSEFGAGEY